jgi:alcohol dehydrogenase class IV
MGEKTEGVPLMEAAQKAIDAVKVLLKDIGIPDNLSILGAKEEDVAQMAKDAVESGIHMSTPRKIDLSGIEMILKAAL